LGILALRAFAYVFGRVHAFPADLEPAAVELGGSAGSDREERKREKKRLEGKREARLRRLKAGKTGSGLRRSFEVNEIDSN
jgi:hypothetical protein